MARVYFDRRFASRAKSIMPGVRVVAHVDNYQVLVTDTTVNSPVTVHIGVQTDEEKSTLEVVFDAADAVRGIATLEGAVVFGGLVLSTVATGVTASR